MTNKSQPKKLTMKSSKWLLLLLPLLAALILAMQATATATVRAAFPGENGKIVFVRSFFDEEKDGDIRNIYSINPDGSELSQLTDFGGDDNPAWSADGLKIAFDRQDEEDEPDIWVMNANGSGQTNLTDSPGIYDADPTWSPNGEKIAFTTTRDENFEIYVMNADDGTEQTNLTNDGSTDTDPAWSPNGSFIAFSSNREGSYNIYVMNLEDGTLTQLTSTDYSDRAPAWSPDGSQIAFIRFKISEPRILDVFTINVSDGSGLTNITSTYEVIEAGVAWSPDDMQLVYGQGTDSVASNYNLTIKSADGSGSPFNVTTDATRETRPDWAPLVETPPVSDTLYIAAETPGITSDGVAYGPEDILEWDGSQWSHFFDGTTAGLTSHDVNGVHVNAADDIYLSFYQNKISTPGIGNVFGHDMAHYDGSSFSLVFDGSDVGLTTVSEKLDALHVAADPPPGCDAYYLFSFFGDGRVPGVKFSGEDVLGFCATSVGEDTDGLWEMVLDGSAQGMPNNSTFSLSASSDLSVLYITTLDVFAVDSAFGGHSMVYEYNTVTEEFSGPIFDAPANGLLSKVNGLHIAGELP